MQKSKLELVCSGTSNSICFLPLFLYNGDLTIQVSLIKISSAHTNWAAPWSNWQVRNSHNLLVHSSAGLSSIVIHFHVELANYRSYLSGASTISWKVTFYIRYILWLLLVQINYQITHRYKFIFKDQWINNKNTHSFVVLKLVPNKICPQECYNGFGDGVSQKICSFCTLQQRKTAQY